MTTETVEEKIVKHLKDNGQKMSWLAYSIELTPGHLHCILKGEGSAKRDLTDENLEKINAKLNTKFKR